MTSSISLSGYLVIVDEKHVILHGDNSESWKNLGSEYWNRGTCKHVNSERTKCTIKFDSKTEFEKSGETCIARELNGCHANVVACIKKYTFFSKSTGAKISGWQIYAKKIKKSTPAIF